MKPRKAPLHLHSTDEVSCGHRRWLGGVSAVTAMSFPELGAGQQVGFVCCLGELCVYVLTYVLSVLYFN